MDKQIEEIIAYIEKQKKDALEAGKNGEDKSYIFGKIVACYEIQGFIDSLSKQNLT